MFKIVAFLALAAVGSVVFSLPVMAEEGLPPQEEAQVNIDKALCTYAHQYRKPDDVDFQPGVDVQGNPVVEADLTQSSPFEAETITFDVTVDVARYLAIPAPEGLEGRAVIGTIAWENGQLTYNGEPLTDPTAQAINDICDGKQPTDPPAAPTVPQPVKNP